MTEIIAKKKGNNKMLPKHLIVDNIEINKHIVYCRKM